MLYFTDPANGGIIRAEEKKPCPRKSTPPETTPWILAAWSTLFTDEDKAREFLESQRWPDGKAICPHCGGEGYALTSKIDSKNPTPPGVKKCKDCRKKFTVRIGTIFEESRLPLSKWLIAFHWMTSSKKGVSAHQIARELDVTVKTAWFLCHRIREASGRRMSGWTRNSPATRLYATAGGNTQKRG